MGIQSNTSPYYIGLMSGTSVDGIDAVLVQFDPFKLVFSHHLPIPEAIRQQALYYSMEAEPSIPAIAALDAHYGALFAEAVLTLLERAGVTSHQVCAIGSHGQTLRHMPHGPIPFSLQVGDPQYIAQATGICTVSHFRQDDMAVGGQGAPLAPAFHAWFFRNIFTDCVVVNIGGIANISYIPQDAPVIGFDTGPGNSLLDAWNQRHQGTPYDTDGQWARNGTLIPALLAQLYTEPFFHLPPPKSTGKDLFNLRWLDAHLTKANTIYLPEDVQHTLVYLTASTIRDALLSYLSKGTLLVCGGGMRNTFLIETLQKLVGSAYNVRATTDYGLAPEWVEAACFAWLARERLAGRPGNLPSVTGAHIAVPLGRVTQPTY